MAAAVINEAALHLNAHPNYFLGKIQEAKQDLSSDSTFAIFAKPGWQGENCLSVETLTAFLWQKRNVDISAPQPRVLCLHWGCHLVPLTATPPALPPHLSSQCSPPHLSQ